MADVGTAIRQFIVAQSSVASLISSRMYPDELPQNAIIPAATYHRISTRHVESIKGTDVNLAFVILEIQAFGSTRAEARAVADAIRRSGVMALDGVYSGVRIRSVSCIGGQQDFTEPPTDGTHQLRYVSSQDFRVTYEDSPA